MPAIRMAFPVPPSRVWQGGFNYLLNLVRSLADFERDRLRPVVFLGSDASNEDHDLFHAATGVAPVVADCFSRQGRALRQLGTIILGVDRECSRHFSSTRVEAVFESARFFGRSLDLPAIAWFPDLQHRTLSQLFGTVAWWRRELGFRAQIAGGRHVLVSSEDARNDVERFFPGTGVRIQVLSFPALITEADLEPDPAATVAQYGIERPFILLPNHFWRHKNHALVIEALGKLRVANKSVSVIATGQPHDARQPALHASLLARADSLSVNDHFRSLGNIPRPHLVSLLRCCAALLNPSRCEGWSSTVEEAKAFGVPMVLSDLAVHREQADRKAAFFGVDDVDRLAVVLAEAVENASPTAGPRHLKVDLVHARRCFAARFADIVAELIAGRGSIR